MREDYNLTFSEISVVWHRKPKNLPFIEILFNLDKYYFVNLDFSLILEETFTKYFSLIGFLSILIL